jgi:nucleotide-binding universal stress UspA family protein
VIVVGVDHSVGAKEALRFALEEAQLRQATLHAVHAWQFGYIGVTGMEGGLPAVGGELHEYRDAVAAALDATLRDAIPDAGDVEVERSKPDTK